MSDADKLFDTLFDEGTSNVVPLNRQAERPGKGEGGDAFAAQGTTTEAAEGQATSAFQREWYLVEGGVQVGPLIIAEVEERWTAREINQETLVWKPGMGDWASIADTPDLIYLITKRPQVTIRVPTYGMPIDDAAGSMDVDLGAAGEPVTTNQPSGNFVTPVTFSGQPGAEAISWRPSAAKALASLVEDELTAQAEPRPLSGPAPGAEKAAPPGFAGIDLFAPAVQPELTSMPDVGSGFPGSSPFGGAAFGGGGWAVPTPRPKPGFELRASHVLVGLLSIALIALVGIVAVAVLRGPTAPLPEVAGITPPANTGAATTTAAKPTENAVASAADKDAAKPAEPTTEASEAPAEASPASSKPIAVAPKPAAKPATGDHVPSPPKPPKPAARPAPKEGMDDVFDKPKASSDKPLDVKDIHAGVKAGQRSVLPCLQRAQRSAELAPGRYKLLLAWEIEPSGAVESPKVTGPANVLGTSIPACFALAMRKWKFPASSAGAPVRNYPFGPFTVK